MKRRKNKARHRKETRTRFPKELNKHKLGATFLAAAMSIGVTGVYVSNTSAALTSSKTVRASAAAEIWIVPSVNPAAADFQSATVSWAQTGSYTSYTLQYSKTSTFTSYSTVVVNGLTTTVSGLTSNTTYYFRVKPTASPTGTWKTGSALIPAWTSTLVGTGWNGYLPAAAGDLNKDGARDFVTIQKSSGTLWMYPGWNSGGVSSTNRVQVATGFAALYPRIFGSGDWNGDGREDIMTIDNSGLMWLYPALQTFGTNAAYGARVQVGSGWGPYTQVGGAGDLTGDGNVDLITVDSSGTLKIYPGASGNAFGTAFAVSGGWARFGGVVGIGDLNKDGHNDVLAIDATTGQGWFYAGTGASNTTAFKAGVVVPNMVVNSGANDFMSGGDMDADGYWDLTETAADGNMYFWKGSDIATALGF